MISTSNIRRSVAAWDTPRVERNYYYFNETFTKQDSRRTGVNTENVSFKIMPKLNNNLLEIVKITVKTKSSFDYISLTIGGGAVQTYYTPIGNENNEYVVYNNDIGIPYFMILYQSIDVNIMNMNDDSIETIVEYKSLYDSDFMIKFDRPIINNLLNRTCLIFGSSRGHGAKVLTRREMIDNINTNNIDIPIDNIEEEYYNNLPRLTENFFETSSKKEIYVPNGDYRRPVYKYRNLILFLEDDDDGTLETTFFINHNSDGNSREIYNTVEFNIRKHLRMLCKNVYEYSSYEGFIDFKINVGSQVSVISTHNNYLRTANLLCGIKYYVGDN